MTYNQFDKAMNLIKDFYEKKEIAENAVESMLGNSDFGSAYFSWPVPIVEFTVDLINEQLQVIDKELLSWYIHETKFYADPNLKAFTKRNKIIDLSTNKKLYKYLTENK